MGAGNSNMAATRNSLNSSLRSLLPVARAFGTVRLAVIVFLQYFEIDPV